YFYSFHYSAHPRVLHSFPTRRSSDLEYRTRSLGPGPHDLDVPRTLLFSLFLFASSGTVYLAERRLARDDQRGFATWWLASIGLRSEEHTSELQSRGHLVCRLLLEKKK